MSSYTPDELLLDEVFKISPLEEELELVLIWKPLELVFVNPDEELDVVDKLPELLLDEVFKISPLEEEERFLSSS